MAKFLRTFVVDSLSNSQQSAPPIIAFPTVGYNDSMNFQYSKTVSDLTSKQHH